MTVEVNFDGLVGPTHNYAGLSVGNRASIENANQVSSPRRAALQGLAKMRCLLGLGLTQAVLPPQRRPHRGFLAQLGLSPEDGSDAVAAIGAELVPLAWSASSMWAANAATVSPSADTADGRVHLTPANLWSTPHRALETAETERLLRMVFGCEQHFVVHRALPAVAPLADEGAANHGRLVEGHGQPGTHLFVYGRAGDEPPIDTATEGGAPRRQSLAASRAIARSHGLDPTRVVYARQSARAIDAGAFHNDVVAVTNGQVLFTHAAAFDDPATVYEALGAEVIEVGEDQVPLVDAIASYLFNSQLVTVADGAMVLIAPAEAGTIGSTAAYLAEAVADPANPISDVQFIDLRESMRNGGGPACLRLRVVLTEPELAALVGRVIVDHELLDQLEDWVARHYRQELAPADLFDRRLVGEVAAALDELSAILDLPDLYRA